MLNPGPETGCGRLDAFLVLPPLLTPNVSPHQSPCNTCPSGGTSRGQESTGTATTCHVVQSKHKSYLGRYNTLSIGYLLYCPALHSLYSYLYRDSTPPPSPPFSLRSLLSHTSDSCHPPIYSTKFPSRICGPVLLGMASRCFYVDKITSARKLQDEVDNYPSLVNLLRRGASLPAPALGARNNCSPVGCCFPNA